MPLGPLQARQLNNSKQSKGRGYNTIYTRDRARNACAGETYSAAPDSEPLNLTSGGHPIQSRAGHSCDICAICVCRVFTPATFTAQPYSHISGSSHSVRDIEGHAELSSSVYPISLRIRFSLVPAYGFLLITVEMAAPRYRYPQVLLIGDSIVQ